MNNRIYALSSAVAANVMLPLAVSADARPGDEKKPNVVFILIDDMGWRDLSCFGSDFYETPNIDRMAQMGTMFSQAYAPCHVSSPSRASLLTGMYPASLGITDWLPGRREYSFQRLSTTNVVQDLPAEAKTIAETLRDNGYGTAMIGKWHLGETGSVPQEHGFDIHIPNGFLRGWPDTYYAPFNMNGYNGEEGDYLTDKMTDEAINYIEENKDRPFFLMLSHFAVHDPVEGRADLVEKYKAKLKNMPESQLREYVLEGNPDGSETFTAEELEALIDNPLYESHRILPRNLVKIKQIQDNVHFAAMVESVDESVGRISATLDSLGIADNTIMIFYSDNGGMSAANYGNPNRVVPQAQIDKAYSTSVAPLRGGKGWLYEGGLRVPLIIRWSGNISEGAVSDIPVTGPDLYKTIVSMTGVKAPEGAGADGIDIYSELQGRTTTDRAIFWHFPHYSNHGMLTPSGAVRYGDYKLIEYYENGTVQLFNLRDDVRETTDISAGNPQIVSDLKRRLKEWRESVGAEMPSENLSFDWEYYNLRYIDVAPPKFFPSMVTTGLPYENAAGSGACLRSGRVSSLVEKYESTHNEKFLKKAVKGFAAGRSEVSEDGSVAAGSLKESLERAVGAMALYQATGEDKYRDAAMQVRKNVIDNSMVDVQADDYLVYCWNKLSSMLFAMNGNGYMMSAVVPVDDTAPAKYRKAYAALIGRNLAGDLNNNMLVMPLMDYTVSPGVKFGGGQIGVKASEGEISVTLSEYKVPKVYQKYSIEIFVRNKKDVAKVTLNGKPVQWKYNNRGFVTVASLWAEGDEIKIHLKIVDNHKIG